MALAKMDAALLFRMLRNWSSDQETLVESLSTNLADLIDAGFIPAGVTLPSQRELSSVLGVSRGTVAAAMTQLEQHNYLVIQKGSGARVRSGRSRRSANSSGRFFTLTNAPADVIDLSTGAMPASQVTRSLLNERIDDINPYLETDGYFPAGLPVLRQALAQHLTELGIDTHPQEILITSGAQAASQLAIKHLTDPGDLVLVEDPTYRGLLEALSENNCRIQGISTGNSGINVDLFAHAVKRSPKILCCQTGVHNPTGSSMPASQRRDLAKLTNSKRVPVIEDCCNFELVLHGKSAPTLANLVDPQLLIQIGTCSKLFWGGLRIGWVRADKATIRRLVELRKISDIATAIIEQIFATHLLGHAAEAQTERQEQLFAGLVATEEIVKARRPDWSWHRPRGGTGLWIDTGESTQVLASKAEKVGVKLATGPSFSPHNGQERFLRVPLWHEPDVLLEAFKRLDGVA